jgi:hypothetical protein
MDRQAPAPLVDLPELTRLDRAASMKPSSTIAKSGAERREGIVTLPSAANDGGR